MKCDTKSGWMVSKRGSSGDGLGVGKGSIQPDFVIKTGLEVLQ